MALDKKLHLLGGFIISTVIIAYGLFTKGWNIDVYATYSSYSVAATMIVGVGKEMYDYVTSKYLGFNHTVEAKDAAYTVYGSLIYFVLGFFLGAGGHGL